LGISTKRYVEATAFTHRGLLRANNEDTITVAGWVSDTEMAVARRSRHALSEPLLFALADGMGGQAGGEIASRYAIKRLAQPMTPSEQGLSERLAAINAELYQTMAAVPSLVGMGTTAVGLLLAAERAIWFNIGDSRLYRQRGARLEQLSTDDVPPGRRSGMITQTLGGAGSFMPIAPHLGGEDLQVPSRWLLCSDGLTDMVAESELERAMVRDDEEALGALFTQAMAAGGADNVSIILVSAIAS
jgi:PPM family protein phosphatase